jgi:hypothetical protein
MTEEPPENRTILFVLFLIIAFLLGASVIYFFGSTKSYIPRGALEQCEQAWDYVYSDYTDCRYDLANETYKRESCERNIKGLFRIK